MFGKKLQLFSLFGFKVSVDFTWILLAVLITWSLASGLFPHYFAGLSQAAYWWMGVAGAIGLFISIVFHEFCHSLVARHFGLPMKGITLFIFGGVAEMDDEPNSPKTEFLMAIAGPASSLLLGGIFYGLGRLGRGIGWIEPVNAVLLYLGFLNIVLAIFNLIPAFPLDGGRVLRSILWHVKGNIRQATRIASSIGSGFGVLLIVLGVMAFISGSFIGGAWYFLIGLFIRGASQTSYQQTVLRGALGEETVGTFMKQEPITVAPTVPVDELVSDYFYKYHYKMFPVANGNGLEGCITTEQIKRIPKDQWSTHTAGEIVEPCSEKNTITPDTEAIKALSLMQQTNKSRLLVVDHGRLQGILTLKDMLKALSLKMDLEQ